MNKNKFLLEIYFLKFKSWYKKKNEKNMGVVLFKLIVLFFNDRIV